VDSYKGNKHQYIYNFRLDTMIKYLSILLLFPLFAQAQITCGLGGILYAPNSKPFTHSYSIVTDHTQSGSVNSSTFTVLVNLTLTNLKTVANGGVVQSVTAGIPNDVVFSSSSSYGSYLPYEVEYYNASTGQIIAWVQIPTLSVSVNETVYMGIGSSTITTFQGGSNGAAWNSNFKTVLHCPNGSALSLSDYTANADNGTNEDATAGAGNIDGGMALSGSNQYMKFSSDPLTLTSDFTISGWFNTSTDNGQYPRLFSFIDNANTNFQLIIDDQGGSTGKFAVLLTRSGTATINQVTYTTPSYGAWVYITYTVSGSTGTLYINGSSVSSSGTTSIGIGTIYIPVIGARSDLNSSTYYKGTIDEIHCVGSALSSSWILAEYNNQVSTSTFLTTTLIY